MMATGGRDTNGKAARSLGLFLQNLVFFRCIKSLIPLGHNDL